MSHFGTSKKDNKQYKNIIFPNFFFLTGRVGFEDLAMSLSRPPTAATSTTWGRSSGRKSSKNNKSSKSSSRKSKSKSSTASTADSAADTTGLRQQQQDNSEEQERTQPQPKSRKQVLADLAMVARLRLRLLVVPGAFRAMAKEAMLAEGRAFERYERLRKSDTAVTRRPTPI